MLAEILEAEMKSAAFEVRKPRQRPTADSADPAAPGAADGENGVEAEEHNEGEEEEMKEDDPSVVAGDDVD